MNCASAAKEEIGKEESPEETEKENDPSGVLGQD